MLIKEEEEDHLSLKFTELPLFLNGVLLYFHINLLKTILGQFLVFLPIFYYSAIVLLFQYHTDPAGSCSLQGEITELLRGESQPYPSTTLLFSFQGKFTQFMHPGLIDGIKKQPQNETKQLISPTKKKNLFIFPLTILSTYFT